MVWRRCGVVVVSFVAFMDRTLVCEEYNSEVYHREPDRNRTYAADTRTQHSGTPRAQRTRAVGARAHGACVCLCVFGANATRADGV